MILKRRLVVDIETNNILSEMLDFSTLPYKLKNNSSLWCVVFRDIDTNEVFHQSLSGITKDWIKSVVEGYTEIIAHNGIKFDFVVLKLFGVFDYEIGYLEKPDLLFGNEVKFTDTLVRSRLFNPDRYGGHSLQAWGERLGDYKDDFRQKSIETGIIKSDSPKGSEFQQYSEIMLDYCIQDTKVTAEVYKNLEEEWNSYSGWIKPEKLENKLADLAIRRECYGFWFDKDLAIKCLDDLTEKMDKLRSNVNPLLPPKPLTKTRLKEFTPPTKQFKQDGTYNAHLINFAKKHNSILKDRVFIYKGKEYDLPLTEPLEIVEEADISDLDHVKMHLINLGWNPTEFKVRDLTKNHKKQSIPYEKRHKALLTWLEQTFEEGKYKEHRLKELGMYDKVEIYKKLSQQIKSDKPVRVPTSPCVRVGIEKELCPNLVKLGDKVAFAKDFTLYLTYKHRKSSIAGGDIEDLDFDEEYPNTGFLSMYREEDQRVSTPSIEIGASTNRYRHIGICNIARASSIYGKEMRSLFGCGEGKRQLGFDFSSLEARIQGHYILPFNGEELAQQLLASKPNDIHSINARKFDMPRDLAKSLGYMLMYGGSAARAKSMLGCSMVEAKRIVDGFWDEMKPLKDLRDAVTKAWEKRGKKYVVGIDGRKLVTRSAHSLLNVLFQSGGVICAKYTTVFMYEELESSGYKCNPFESDVDFISMIEYHDECQTAINKDDVELRVFKDEESMNEFVESWSGDQLGSPVELENGMYVVALPNDVSRSIQHSIDRAVEEVGLKVPLAMEWVVANNWYLCH